MKKHLYVCLISYLFVLDVFAAADTSCVRRRCVPQSPARTVRKSPSCKPAGQNAQDSYSPNYGQEGGIDYLEQFRGYVYAQLLNPVSEQKKSD